MTAYLARRPKRADGRRNYDRILAAAREAFDTHGTDAALEDIARAAGVAIGTLYGHFPTRETLIEASVRESLDALRASADRLASSSSSSSDDDDEEEEDDYDDDPVGALTTWIHETVAHCSTFRGLVGFLAASTYDEGTPLHQSCVDMHAAGDALLARAQRAGRVRADISGEDLFTAITSAAWARENSPAGRDRSGRLIEVLIDGMTVR